jgi:hypothetical protein
MTSKSARRRFGLRLPQAQAGLLLEAARDWKIDLSGGYFIGGR